MERQTRSTRSSRHLDTKRKALVGRRDHLLTRFSDAAQHRQSARMQRLCRELQHVNDFLGSLEAIQGEVGSLPAGGRCYVVSSLFLDQCFRDLTADADEQFFFITGSEVDGMSVLDQKIEFLHQKRSMLGVTGNVGATHRLLIKLEQFGHRLLAHFHSHPGLGLSATHPSGTDRNFQQRLENAGYPTIAAIFSRDGYIRFFRLDDDFELQIHGTGVEDLGHHTYRLVNVDPADGKGNSRS